MRKKSLRRNRNLDAPSTPSVKRKGHAGMYDRRHLADDVYTRTLFEWAHPEIAVHCRNRGVAYPELDDSGEIVGDFPR